MNAPAVTVTPRKNAMPAIRQGLLVWAALALRRCLAIRALVDFKLLRAIALSIRARPVAKCLSDLAGQISTPNTSLQQCQKAHSRSRTDDNADKPNEVVKNL